jgi:hypothetical protein
VDGRTGARSRGWLASSLFLLFAHFKNCKTPISLIEVEILQK